MWCKLESGACRVQSCHLRQAFALFSCFSLRYASWHCACMAMVCLRIFCSLSHSVMGHLMGGTSQKVVC